MGNVNHFHCFLLILPQNALTWLVGCRGNIPSLQFLLPQGPPNDDLVTYALVYLYFDICHRYSYM